MIRCGTIDDSALSHAQQIIIEGLIASERPREIFGWSELSGIGLGVTSNLIRGTKVIDSTLIAAFLLRIRTKPTAQICPRDHGWRGELYAAPRPCLTR
jgi:hypothetical protein